MSSEKKTVLVVDDEPDLVETTCTILESAGFLTVQASSGQEGWKLFEANKDITLVLSDIRMPGGEGTWLLKKIRESKRPHVGFVFMSAFSDYSRADLLALGADELFSKPFDASALVKFLRSRAAR